VKKTIIPLFLLFILSASCQKQSSKINHTNTINTTVLSRGAGLNLNVVIDADNTTAEVMGVIEEVLQPANIYVKIGNYNGGTDTAKKSSS